MIYGDAAELIGNTPLLNASRFASAYELRAELLVKLESRNPGGSAKDRIALHMIEAAEKRGEIAPGATLIEATSGNTGIGLGVVAASRGYRVILTMPNNMSSERIKILRALGVRIELTDARRGMAGANEKAQELLETTPNAMRMLQFDNADNPAAHEATTGPEIWRDANGRLDAFVAAVGTGGTLCGTARYLKRQDGRICVAAVEPSESPLLSGGKAGAHGIQGIGANFVPANYDAGLVDCVIGVSTQEAMHSARRFMRAEGILCGISGGAALWGSVKLAKERFSNGGRIVTILPDTGERYLSTELFGEQKT